MISQNKKTSLVIAIIPIIFLVILLAFNVWIFGDDSLSGYNQFALLLSAGIASVIGFFIKIKWKTMLDGVVKSISSSMSAILILLLIGSLAGTWMLSGIVPAMIYYGLDILSPSIFLFATCIVCAVISLSTGSSWSTIATIGIAMLGIGQALGIHEGLIGGAIISGAYFGDKMSPLSDTTNLAPAMAGTDLISHIKYMMWTTIPSISISLIIFSIIGFVSFGGEGDLNEVTNMQEALISKYNITPWLFLVPAAVIFMIIKKVPAIPALLTGVLLGGVFAIIFQANVIIELCNIVDVSYIKASYISVMKSIATDVQIDTGYASVNELVSTGGMAGMLNTIWLIVCAMCFGGMMEATGLLSIITDSLMKFVKSRKSLVLTTSGTCLFFNITASDQYIAIVVPGRMFASSYKKYDLAPENLSRTLEDTATVTSVLVPWNTCGATQSGVLGVATIAYLPYCFFNIISPIMTILFAYFSIKIKYIKDKGLKSDSST